MAYRIGICGGNFTTPKGILSSPSYPDSYPTHTNCVYTVTQLNGTIIRLEMMQMDMNHYWFDDHICEYADYLEIRDGNSESSPLIGKFCGSNIPPNVIQSSGNHLWIK